MKVLVSDNLSPAGINVLQEEKGIVVDVKPGMAKEELCKEIRHYDGLIVRSGTKVTADVIEAAKRLKVIARAGVGVDNIDVDAATKRGIIVMNAPTGNTVSTAEHTFSLLLALSRNVSRADRSMRGGKWERKRFVGTELYDKVLGIIGLGRVGTEVAKRARGFGPHILYHKRSRLPVAEEERLGVEYVGFEELLKRSDILSIHVPLTPETRGMIGREEIASMKKGAILLNLARGGIVDEGALIEALKEGRLSGAGLDVIEDEPLGPDNIFDGVENVMLSPHISGASKETFGRAFRMCGENLARFFAGEELENVVNLK